MLLAVRIVVECVIALLCIVSNTVVLVVIHRYRVFCETTKYFIASLAVADLLVGIVIPPRLILQIYGPPMGFYACVVLSSLIIILTNVSVVNLMALTLDRYLAISKPYFYANKATTRVALGTVTVAWLLGVALGLPPWLGWHCPKEDYRGKCSFGAVMTKSYVVSMEVGVLYAPSMVFMFCVYVHIFLIVRKHIRSSQTQEAAAGIHRRGTYRGLEVRAAYTVFLVVILFFICWLPIRVCNVVSFVYPHVRKSHAYRDVFRVSIFLAHSNSFVNPIVYVFTTSHFKLALSRLRAGDMTTSFGSLPNVHFPRTTSSGRWSDCPENGIPTALAAPSNIPSTSAVSCGDQEDPHTKRDPKDEHRRSVLFTLPGQVDSPPPS